MNRKVLIAAVVCLFAGAQVQSRETGAGQVTPLWGLQAEAAGKVEGRKKLTQVIIDTLFSFSELGFQEFETQKYLSALLTKNGFSVETGVSGIPSAWWATWKSGAPGKGPVIALGTDVDGIPKASQKPGIAWPEPLVPGGPGQGRRHPDDDRLTGGDLDGDLRAAHDVADPIPAVVVAIAAQRQDDNHEDDQEPGEPAYDPFASKSPQHAPSKFPHYMLLYTDLSP